ncbi:peptidylprolyl isomerase [Salinimicrobium terrae]|uniref:peptidylprolyl isomerase n=1 Tax=Salinimicrobium terrae TaxID=470866 RepID=UPI0003F9E230|nr:peptidylprolyl isomerase [Salinimicrobium terrae]
MAVLNSIRQRSVFLIVIIALALFSFVLADVIRNGGMVSQKSQNTIATINGEDIEREQFARQVEAVQRNMGQNATTSQVVARVWEMNVRRALMQEQFEELGIRVEEAQVKEMMRLELGNNPSFTNEAGVFDEAKLREYVATLKSTSPQAYQQWVEYENNLAETAREQIYLNLVRAGVGATLLEGEQAYQFDNDNVNMEFVYIPYSTVEDAQVEVSKAEIRDYIEANPGKFETEPTRDIQYVLYEETPSVEDETEVKTELLGLLNERVEFNTATNATDTIEGFATTGDWETFVNERSDEKFQDRFLFKNQLPAEHADSLFNLHEGEVYGPFKFNNSWRVARVVETAQIPDSVKARHILVTWQGSPVGGEVTRSKQQAEQLADSLANVVRADRDEFADLASQFSADASNKEDAGELGWAGPGTFLPRFNDFIFENSAGEIGVVESEFGYHVIHIQEQTDREKAVKLATVSRTSEPSEKTANNLYAEVTRFELGTQDANFSDLAKESGKEVRPVMEIQELEENIPGIGAQRTIVQWAFEDDVEVGDVRRFEVPSGYVVAQVTAVNEGGLKSAEAASSTVIPILQKQKKAEIIKSEISGNTLEEIAQNQGVQVNTASAVNRNSPTLPGVGSEPKVVGVAFGLESGETSNPVAGEKGVFVVEVLQKIDAPQMESYQPYAAREASARRTTVNTEVFEALKESAEIEDNRARFY